MNNKNLLHSKKLFFISLGIDMLVTALVTISAFWTLGTLQDIRNGTQEVSPSLISTLEFWENFSRLTILTVICVGLALVKWLNACYRYAKDAIGATGFQNEGWTAAAWIVPLLNLFKPYKVINEIYRAGSPGYQTPDGWKQESRSGLLLIWWVFWAFTHFVMWMITKEMLKKSFRDDVTFNQIVSMYETQVGACVISLVVAVLWFVVANHLTGRLLARSPVNVAAASPITSGDNEPSTPTDQPTYQAAPSVPLAPLAPTQPVAPLPDAVAKPRSGAKVVSDQIDEEAIYAAIAEEMETGNTDRGLWTKLFAECDGDEGRTKVAYIRERAARLISAEAARLSTSN